MYHLYDDDPNADTEAIETQRRDVDLEMAEMERAGNAIWAARAAGRCTHQSAAGYRRPAAYPEQEALRPGQVACTEHHNGCVAVFDSDEAWHAAMDEAVMA